MYPATLADHIRYLMELDGHLGSSLEDAAKHFKCCRPVLDPVFAKADEISPGGIIIAGALAGLQCRIERRPPTLVEGEA